MQPSASRPKEVLSEPVENFIVVGDCSFRVAVSPRTPRSLSVTVVRDAREQWSFETAGWRPLSFGAAEGVFYLWSARKLIVFPKSQDPLEFELDEDLLLAFNLGHGFLLVCETSVRLIVDGVQRTRVELGEVIEAAYSDGGRLIVRDEGGSESLIVVNPDDLVVEAL